MQIGVFFTKRDMQELRYRISRVDIMEHLAMEATIRSINLDQHIEPIGTTYMIELIISKDDIKKITVGKKLIKIIDVEG